MTPGQPCIHSTYIHTHVHTYEYLSLTFSHGPCSPRLHLKKKEGKKMKKPAARTHSYMTRDYARALVATTD
jgi:hypothetical protein